MTKGDRDKLRAELAGKAMQGILSNPGVLIYADQAIDSDGSLTRGAWYAGQATAFADALMAELGISMDKED